MDGVIRKCKEGKKTERHIALFFDVLVCKRGTAYNSQAAVQYANDKKEDMKSPGTRREYV